MSLSSRIFIGLFAGIATGLFFGEIVADLKVFGDVFIALLQMTVLPYIMVSLIAGFGRMKLDQAKRLAVRGSLLLLVIWGMALLLIFAASLAFPDLDTASFFSAVQPDAAEPTNLLELYVPANVFYSLSNNLVPAVVLFSILLGVALISVDYKSAVLPIVDGIAEALSRINSAMVQLTPYGIFAIAAAAAGTMTVEELGRVQVYLVTYIALSAVVTFWVFPGLVAAISGIPFREVLTTFRDPLVTTFATGNQFVVLPLIAEKCKELMRKHNRLGDDEESAIDIIVPVSFNFPSLGKLLVLLFVLFAAWFTDTSLSLGDHFSLAINGVLSLFGSINVAVPYLLDELRIPADMFQLFLVTGVIIGRFGATLAALHIIVISILGTLALGGMLRFEARALLRYGALTLLSCVLLVGLLRGYFAVFVPESPQRDAVLAQIELMDERVPAVVRTLVPDAPSTLPPGSRFDAIREAGVLRVGYRPANLPCSFMTDDGELVGFDVEMAHVLAEDLALGLEFVPFDYANLEALLSTGQIDVAMSCIAALPERFAMAGFSKPYLDLHLALIVPDHERARYRDPQNLPKGEDLRIALVGSHYFQSRVHRYFPGAQIVIIDGAEDFFTQPGLADAVVLSAEEGSAYTFRYPKFSVARPSTGGVSFPAAYAVPRGDTELRTLISSWVDLKERDGTIDALFGYWFHGGASAPRRPRWSVIRDVLGWVD